jgi:hypothetical protein
MHSTTNEMIAALDAFEPDTGYDENQFRLYPIIEKFATFPDKERVIPAMFSLMERFPDTYLGTPGPLVHSIESLGIEKYETLLVESVHRRPTELNTWMVNRILNTKLDASHRERLLELLRIVLRHPKAPVRVANSARHFLEFQAKRLRA